MAAPEAQPAGTIPDVREPQNMHAIPLLALVKGAMSHLLKTPLRLHHGCMCSAMTVEGLEEVQQQVGLLTQLNVLDTYIC